MNKAKKKINNKKCNLNKKKKKKKQKRHQKKKKLTSAQVYFVRHKLFDTNGKSFFYYYYFISVCIFPCFLLILLFSMAETMFFKTALPTFMTAFFRFYLKNKQKKTNYKKKKYELCVCVCVFLNYFSLVKFFSSFVVQKQKSWKNHGETFLKTLFPVFLPIISPIFIFEIVHFPSRVARN